MAARLRWGWVPAFAGRAGDPHPFGKLKTGYFFPGPAGEEVGDLLPVCYERELVGRSSIRAGCRSPQPRSWPFSMALRSHLLSPMGRPGLDS